MANQESESEKELSNREDNQQPKKEERKLRNQESESEEKLNSQQDNQQPKEEERKLRDRANIRKPPKYKEFVLDIENLFVAESKQPLTYEEVIQSADSEA